MSQHFLLSAKARSLLLIYVANMGEDHLRDKNYLNFTTRGKYSLILFFNFFLLRSKKRWKYHAVQY